MSKVIKSIVDAAEEARRRTVALPYPTKTPQPTVALPYPTKTPQPTVALPYPTKLPIPVKAPRIGNNMADAGNTLVRQYNRLEKGVQTAETVDSAVSNIGAAAGGVMRTAAVVGRLAPAAAHMAQSLNLAKVVPALNAARVAGSRLAPVQAGLWGVDAGRAVLDSEYRAETLASTHNLFDDPNKSTVRKSFDVAANTLARPVAMPASMMRSYADSSERIRNAEIQMAKTDERLHTLKSAIREEKWAQGVDTARRYMGQVAREARIRRKFEEPVAPQQDYTPQERPKPVFPKSIREIRRTPLLKR